MTHWKVLTSNSETISAADLGDKVVTVTIESVAGAVFESEDGSKDKKALISFKGHERKFAANSVNCQLLASWLGDEVEGWVGHSISIAADTVEVRGALYGKPCIRVVGSPELDQAVTVTIKLPRRKPLQRKLTPTRTRSTKNGATQEVGIDTASDAPDAVDGNVGQNPATLGLDE